MPELPTLPHDHAALMARIAAQADREAFIILFDYYAPRINAYLQRLGSDKTAAEDMTQDVMMVLWRKAHLFDPQKSQLGTWLYRIARNRRIDVARRGRIDILDIDDQILQIADETHHADVQMDMEERSTFVREALTTLPADQRDLVHLSFFEQLSHSEISARTGLPLGTVKSRIRLAFTRLRRALEQKGIDGAL
jgi:RNA polymerase sigma-70 factor (ECF subfamily)